MTALISFRRLMTIMAAALLAACAVGPDYRAPDVPAVGIYTEKPQPERTGAAPVRGGEAQRFEVGGKISAEWWTLFGSPELDLLIRSALSGQPTLAAAQAALRQAEENVNAQYSVLYPSVDAGLSARRQHIRATREISEAQDAQLQIAEKQFKLGAISGSDLLGQRAQAAQTRATLPPLEKALAQTRNQLAVLVGKLPADAKLPQLDFSAFKLPQELPLSVPSELLRQRPDVRQAEAIMRQTNARIGVAEALMFPQLTLSGSYGSAATRT